MESVLLWAALHEEVPYPICPRTVLLVLTNFSGSEMVGELENSVGVGRRTRLCRLQVLQITGPMELTLCHRDRRLCRWEEEEAC